MKGSSITHQKTFNTWLILKITYGILFLILGLDKFFNFFINWSDYISFGILKNLFPKIFVLLVIVSIIEIFLGILVLTKWTRSGAYAMAGWFLIVAINLLRYKLFYISVLIISLSAGAIALARLTEIKDEIK